MSMLKYDTLLQVKVIDYLGLNTYFECNLFWMQLILKSEGKPMLRYVHAVGMRILNDYGFFNFKYLNTYKLHCMILPFCFCWLE